MPRRPNVDPRRAPVRKLGHEPTSASTRGQQDLKPKHAKSCKVPTCRRRSSSKRMCQSHYAKARKLKMNLDKLSAANLTLLGQDGRTLRWKR